LGLSVFLTAFFIAAFLAATFACLVAILDDLFAVTRLLYAHLALGASL
jgi:hypothetical protein